MEKDARSLTPDAQAALRWRAVKALRGGMLLSEVARFFGVCRQAIYNWMARADSGGDAALSPRKRGPKEGRGKLKGWQAATICNLIRDRHPEQLKMPFVLWTSDAVRQLIARRFGVRLSARSVRRYLARWGFTPQKPVRRAYERDPKAVERWLKTEYLLIRRAAKRLQARIYWGDAMGVRSDHQAGRSYAPRGRTPTIPGTGRRFGANIFSAITNRGDLAFMVFKRRFTVTVFLRFLRRLVKHARRPVFLIVDRHPVHRSRAVRQWLKKNRKRIRLFYLPAYSPDLNPDEMLNHDVKTNAVGKRRPHNQPELMRHLRGYLDRRRARPHLVRRYFHEASVRYAAL